MYTTPVNYSGTFRNTQFEFFRFVGSELFVIFISFLMRENRWDVISNILDDGIFVKNTVAGNSDSVSFAYIGQHAIRLFEYRKQRLKLNRMSIHADLLNERHSIGKLAEICPIDQFIDADFFLFVRKNSGWRPRSTLYLSRHIPRFIVEAKREKYAKRLLAPLKAKDIEELQKLLADGNAQLHQFYSSGFWDSSLDSFNFMIIGSLP